MQHVCDFRVILHKFSQWAAQVAAVSDSQPLLSAAITLKTTGVFCLFIPWTLPVLGVTLWKVLEEEEMCLGQSLWSVSWGRERSACGREVLWEQEEAGTNCPDWERVGMG